MARLWATGEWLIQLAAIAGDDVEEHREYVLGPLWDANQVESAAYGLKCAMERDWDLRTHVSGDVLGL